VTEASDTVHRLVNGDITTAVDTISGLDEEQRRQLGTELTAYVRRHRDEWWFRWQATALAVAAVGCLPTAAQAAEVLGRRNISLLSTPAAPVIEVARRRGVTWLTDLAYRLAGRIDRESPGDNWWFIADLLTAEQAAPPTDDLFVLGWAVTASRPRDHEWGEALVDRMRRHPFLDVLAPRMFDVDGVGVQWAWTDQQSDGRSGMPLALAQLAAEGRLDRTMLLDGALGRMLRGERPAALRVFIGLHDALVPTGDEVRDRLPTYLRLLADGPSTAAALAQRTLRKLPDIDLGALLDTAPAVLGRPEKALVRAQLSWLDQLARRNRAQAARIAAVLAVAADHPAVDVADRAAALAAKHGHRVAAPAEVRHVGDALPPVPPPAAAPPPITDPDELAEEIAALFGGSLTDALGLERILDGLIRSATADRAATVAALTPVLDRAGVLAWSSRPEERFGGLGGVLRILAGSDDPAPPRSWQVLLSTWGQQQASGQRPTDPQQAVLRRLRRTRVAEIGRAVAGAGTAELAGAGTAELAGPGAVGLVAAPSLATGAVAPEELFDRLVRLGERQPWPADLTQALLRLPAVVDEPLAAKAAALGTPAGQALADWLRCGGLPRPHYRVVTAVRRRRQGSYDYWHDRLPTRRRVVEASVPHGMADQYGLLNVPARPVDIASSADERHWPAQLPGYRGLVAAYVLPLVAGSADLDEPGGGELLPMLAECTGETTPALDLAVAYGLAARHEADRVAAVDALLMLAAAGGLDAVAVGGHLGALTADKMITLSRVVQPLRDAAAAGAPLTTWRILAAALPPLLTVQPAPRGLPDLLALAAQTVAVTGVRIDLPGLADVAARGGSSRLVTEARRLVAAAR